eukprot:ANDGO_01266.mRNA.1 loc549482 protein
MSRNLGVPQNHDDCDDDDGDDAIPVAPRLAQRSGQLLSLAPFQLTVQSIPVADHHGLMMSDGNGPNENGQLLIWFCKGCDKPCLPIKEEARCMCGHRRKVHGPNGGVMKCQDAKCKCRSFFYIFGQGAFILRCRCKHKAIEHDASHPDHPCVKAGCKCTQFESPWVCNCNHAWASHEQRFVSRSASLAMKHVLAELEHDAHISSNFEDVQRGGDDDDA